MSDDEKGHEHGSERRLLAAIKAARRDLKDLFKQELGLITAELERIKTPVQIIIIASGQSIHVPGLQQEKDMSYTVARDHANEAFTLDPITASDSEGPVTADFTERLESSDDSVVAVAGSELSFGTNGGATVNRIVTYKGTDYIIASLVFNVTPGALTFVGNINVPGLTPDAE